MSTKKVFWGLFFITFGLLIINAKYDFFDTSFGWILEYWPLIFIFWGLSVLTKDSKARPLVSFFFGIFMSVLIYAFIADLIFEDNIRELNYYSDYEFVEEFDESIKYADLYLEAAVTSLNVGRKTNKLVKASLAGNRSNYYFTTSNRDSSARVELDLRDAKFRIFRDYFDDNHLDVQLNKIPIWNIDIQAGAVKSILDLTDFKVEKLKIESGASSFKVKLGDNYPLTKVDVDMGAASLVFNIPKESGCRLEGDWGLLVKDLDDFYKFNSDYYETENYMQAENKIIIDFDGGVSSLKINRY